MTKNPTGRNGRGAPGRGADRTFAVVHNIPSPYRLHLFNVLARALEHRGYLLRVHFMARGHGDRAHWRDLGGALGFEHAFWSDVGPTVRGKEWHLNPQMIASLAARPPEALLVGGPWDSLTGAALSVLPSRALKIGWFEGNTMTPGRVTGAAVRMKRALLRRYDFLAVPGAEGERLTRRILGDAPGPRLALIPNLVDETRFRPVGDPAARERVRHELGVRPGERLALWNARFIPAKGVPEFLSILDPELLKGWRIAILGDGPLREEIRRMRADRGLEDLVRLVPYWPYDRMPDVYRASDLFLLPSLSDPNPLSVVEAMHSGLPLLLSRRVGNFPEALREGENGWSFEPTDRASAGAAVVQAFSAGPEQLRAMGQRSRELAADFWSSEAAVQRFLDAVLAGGSSTGDGVSDDSEVRR